MLTRCGALGPRIPAVRGGTRVIDCCANYNHPEALGQFPLLHREGVTVCVNANRPLLRFCGQCDDHPRRSPDGKIPAPQLPVLAQPLVAIAEIRTQCDTVEGFFGATNDIYGM